MSVLIQLQAAFLQVFTNSFGPFSGHLPSPQAQGVGEPGGGGVGEPGRRGVGGLGGRRGREEQSTRK